jgi:hypothetical protein
MQDRLYGRKFSLEDTIQPLDMRAIKGNPN